MIFMCALIPISCVAVSLSYGGASAPFALVLPLIFLPLFSLMKDFGKARFFLSSVCRLSAALRFLSLFMRSKEALGDIGAFIFIVVCVVVSCIAAYKENTAFYSAVPIFFITLIMAIYVCFVSFGRPPSEPFSNPSFFERLAAIVCPFGICCAVSHLTVGEPKKRFSSCVLGVAVASVFLIFPVAKAELGFICVPLAILMSAIELKAFASVILRQKNE